MSSLCLLVVSSVGQTYPNISSEYSREEVYTPEQKQEKQYTQNWQSSQQGDCVDLDSLKNIGDGFEEFKNIGSIFLRNESS